MSNKTGNDNLIYLTDLTFINVNRIFVLFFENGADRISFFMYQNCILFINFLKFL